MSRKKKTRRERGSKWEPKVRFRKDRGLWMVDLGTKFTPRKLYFSTQAEAVAKADEKKTEYQGILDGKKQEEKRKAAFNWFNLNTDQQNHLASAYALANGDTARIIHALQYYEKHASTASRTLLLSDMFDEYMNAKQASGKRPRTIRDAKVKLKPFVNHFGKRNITEISTADIEGWLGSQKYSPPTRNAYRVAVSGLFSHAVKRRYLEYNPAAAIEPVKIDQCLPVIHTVADVKALFKAASHFVPTRYAVRGRGPGRKVLQGERRPITDPQEIHETRARVVPYLAIGYFAGLRPENELANLDWKDIDFEGKTIRVTPATAKARRQRYVDMSDNLIQWLRPYAATSGKIGLSKSALKLVRDTAEVAWAKDVMRHSFGSYLLAQNDDASKTALQMGHTRVDVLFNHYRNLVKKSAATDYWNIVPDDMEKDAPSS